MALLVAVFRFLRGAPRHRFRDDLSRFPLEMPEEGTPGYASTATQQKLGRICPLPTQIYSIIENRCQVTDLQQVQAVLCGLDLHLQAL